MMMSFRFAAALFCGTLLIAGGCSDPASVGTGLGPDSLSGGDPQTQHIVASALDTTVVPPLTGLEGRTRTWRFLAGTVQDPIGGTIRADGSVDFAGSAPRPDTLARAPLDSLQAALRLPITYRHGDTTSTVSIELFDLREEVEMRRAPADTTFPAEATPIASYSIAPGDSSVTLPLPRAWIEEHQAALQDSSAFDASSFNGFKLAAEDGNAVVGFDHGSTTLRVTTPSDTVDFQVDQSFSHVERTAPPATPLPADRLPLLDGVGIQVAFDWDESTALDSLIAGNTLLNRAEITVPVDTAFRHPGAGSNFVRPTPTGYRIQARPTNDVTCSELGLLSLTGAGSSCVLPTLPSWVPDAARVSSQTALTIFDRWFFDVPPLSTVRVEIANRATPSPTPRQTLDRGLPSTAPAVVPVPTPASSRPVEDLPRATLTVTPL
jgi:hypothetical protein